jgi:hypothetical protein
MATQRVEEEQGEILGWFTGGQLMELRTRAVSEDEPCFHLAEFVRPSRSFKSKSRYQFLSVVRGDRLVTAQVYLGPAAAFAADQFQIPGGEIFEGRGKVWHTVGELREIADELRGRKPRRELEPLDLMGALQRHAEEVNRSARRISTFGAGVKLQRD